MVAENQKLRDVHSERARVADLEREVTEVQEENVQLSQRVAQLEAALWDAEGTNHTVARKAAGAVGRGPDARSGEVTSATGEGTGCPEGGAG